MTQNAVQKVLIALLTLSLLTRCGDPVDYSKDNAICKLLATSDGQRKQKFEECLANQAQASTMSSQTIANRDIFIKKLTAENFFNDGGPYLLAEELAIYEHTHLYDAFILKPGDKLRLYKFVMSNEKVVDFSEVDLSSGRVPTSYTLGGAPRFSDVKLEAPVNDFILHLDSYRAPIPCSVYTDQLYIYSLTSFTTGNVNFSNHFINHLNCFDKRYKFDCDKIINADDSRMLLDKLDNLFFYVGAN